MEKYADTLSKNRRLTSKKKIDFERFREKNKGSLYMLFVLTIMMVIWYFAAKAINNSLLLPSFTETMHEFFTGWINQETISNLSLTLGRVFRGFFYAVIIGMPLGLLMGYSQTAMQAISPILNSIRQVPIMAWVPLSIIWFGLGDGPTVFLITMSAVFPLTLNTIEGVRSIDPNYYNAARSMGAKSSHIIFHIVIPGALPNILTGCRLAMGMGWMSVICAEFIATSAGFGFLMVEAQIQLETAQLYALMIMSGIIGFIIDKGIRTIEKNLTSWRFKNATTAS